MITKRQALDDFIERRMLGDDPFGISVEPDYYDDNGALHPGNAQCVYMHSVGGGCAIGKWIPKSLYATRFESKGAQTLFEDHPEIAALFEEPNGGFWQALQQAHDGLAIFMARYGCADTMMNQADRWRRFEEAIREAADLA